MLSKRLITHYTYNSIMSFLEKKINLGMKIVFLDSAQKTYVDTGGVKTIYPMEHRVNTGRAGFYATDEFYAVSDGSYVYKSINGVDLDLYVNIDVAFPGDNYIVRQFTPSTGVHVVFNSGTLGHAGGNIEVYASDYASRTVGTAYDHPPYHMHGIDQNPFTKTICYCEYPADTALTASVWRSVSPYTTWTNVFTVDSYGSRPAQEIRHFHICAADPFVSGQWYLSSGDGVGECHIWKSTDDGLNWTKIITNDTRVRAVHFNIDSTHVYWFEDNVNGGFYRMNKTTEVIETLVPQNIMSGLGYSCIITPQGWVGFYSKSTTGLDPDNSYIYLVDKNYNVKELAKLPDVFTGFKSRMISPTHNTIYSYTENDFSLWGSARIIMCNLVNL